METATVKQVRVKQEVKTERALEGGPKLTPFNMRMESDWLEVKQEVKEDATTSGSTASRAARIKREVGPTRPEGSDTLGTKTLSTFPMLRAFVQGG